MMIFVDGPEKAGKTTLVSEIQSGFDPDRRKTIKHSGPAKENGLEYLRPLVAGLNSPSVYVWDRGWVSEAVYGQLLKDDRRMANDPFLNEWLYGRTMEGRGGKFILLPDDPHVLQDLRDDSDLPVHPVAEFIAFQKYAREWGYQILTNSYTGESLISNGMIARRSAFIPTHNISDMDYIGSLNPTYTFVTNPLQEFPMEPRPFFDTVSVEYFRPFGLSAIKSFGYASVRGFEKREDYPHLFENPIMLGTVARRNFPSYPAVSTFSSSVYTPLKIQNFVKEVMQIITR